MERGKRRERKKERGEGRRGESRRWPAKAVKGPPRPPKLCLPPKRRERRERGRERNGRRGRPTVGAETLRDSPTSPPDLR